MILLQRLISFIMEELYSVVTFIGLDSICYSFMQFFVFLVIIKRLTLTKHIFCLVLKYISIKIEAFLLPLILFIDALLRRLDLYDNAWSCDKYNIGLLYLNVVLIISI